MRKPRRSNRRGVEIGEQLGGVALARPRRVGDPADLAERDAPQLLAREVLLDLFLQLRRERDAGVLEEADLHGLGVGGRRADVERRVVALRLQEMLPDRRRQRAEVGDRHARRVEAGDQGALDHAIGGRALPARDDARAALQRRPERRTQPHRDLRASGRR